MRRYVGIDDDDDGRKALGRGRLEYPCVIMEGGSCFGLALACSLDKG